MKGEITFENSWQPLGSYIEIVDHLVIKGCISRSYGLFESGQVLAERVVLIQDRLRFVG